MIKTIVEPRVVKTREQFCGSSPAYSVALDGYVEGPPWYDSRGPRINFNHHERVHRPSTRSTSGQVYMSIKTGRLFRVFKVDGESTANVHINDPDHDTSLARWMLINHERMEFSRSEPLINRLVYAEDVLDTTGGAYPFDPDSRIMRQIAWIFDPYTQVRKSGALYKMTGLEMEGLMDAIGSRIDAYTLGFGQEKELDTTHETLDSGEGWMMIRELGPYARTKLFNAGVRVLISIKPRDDDSFGYTISKLEDLDDFPIERLGEYLNKLEGINPESTDRWGGGDKFLGSPRIAGSKVKPEKMSKILREVQYSRM